MRVSHSQLSLPAVFILLRTSFEQPWQEIFRIDFRRDPGERYSDYQRGPG